MLVHLVFVELSAFRIIVAVPLFVETVFNEGGVVAECQSAEMVDHALEVVFRLDALLL